MEDKNKSVHYSSNDKEFCADMAQLLQQTSQVLVTGETKIHACFFF